MTYPAQALQAAIFVKVRTDTGLAVAMGGAARAYDRVPPAPAFPYITIPDGQFLDDGDSCEDNRFEVFSDLQVWSRDVGQVTAKAIAGALRAALLGGLAIEGWTATTIHCTGIRHLTDPDGLTARAIVTMRFILEPA